MLTKCKNKHYIYEVYTHFPIVCLNFINRMAKLGSANCSFRKNRIEFL